MHCNSSEHSLETPPLVATASKIRIWMYCQSRWFDISVTANKVIVHRISLLVFLLFLYCHHLNILSPFVMLWCVERMSFLPFIMREFTTFPRWRVFLYHNALRLYTIGKLLWLNNFCSEISLRIWLREFMPIHCRYKCIVFLASKWIL